jgi:hypothetical protein
MAGNGSSVRDKIKIFHPRKSGIFLGNCLDAWRGILSCGQATTPQGIVVWCGRYLCSCGPATF